MVEYVNGVIWICRIWNQYNTEIVEYGNGRIWKAQNMEIVEYGNGRIWEQNTEIVEY